MAVTLLYLSVLFWRIIKKQENQTIVAPDGHSIGYPGAETITWTAGSWVLTLQTLHLRVSLFIISEDS